MTLIVTIFAFNKVAKMPTEEGVPYSIMAFSGVLIWLFFSQMFGQISNSIVGGGNLVSKVYVPRLLIPLSSVAAGLLDFMIGLVMFFILAFFYGFPIGPQVLLMPLFLIMAYGLALGLGLFFTTINVRFRDIAQIVPFVVQFGFFASPIAFSSNVSMKSTAFYSIYNLNPVVGIIDAFRWSLLAGKAPFIWESFIPSLIITTLSLILSFKFFRKMEDSFVDYL